MSQTTELEAARILKAIEPVRYPSAFGERLLAAGVLRSRVGGRQSRQGLALLAGKWLRRMERQGLARGGPDGWTVTAKAVQSLTNEVTHAD